LLVMEGLLTRYQELAAQVTKTMEQTKVDLLQKLHDTETRLAQQLAQLRSEILAAGATQLLDEKSNNQTEISITKSDSESTQKSTQDTTSEASEDESELFNLLSTLHKSPNAPKTSSNVSPAKLTSSWTSPPVQSELSRSKKLQMGHKNDPNIDVPKSIGPSSANPEDSSNAQESGESPRGNEIANAKRVICAVIYRGITEIEGRQKKPTPKKFKNAFEGYATVSFMMETLELKSRDQAVQIANGCMGGYIYNIADETLPFQDSETQYYTFKFPVFMFPEKIAAKLKPSIKTLLRSGNKPVDEAVQFAQKGVANVIRTKAILMKTVLEIADRKGKRWNKRYALLYTHAIKLYKTEDAVEPLQLIILENIKNISYDEYKYDIMDFIRKKSNTLTMPFILTFVQGEKKYQMSVRASSPEEIAQWILAIDGLKYQDKPLLSLENASCLDTSTKYLLLRMLHKDPYRGAMLKHGEDEWQYSEGIISRTVGEPEIRYSWTGETLAPCVDSPINYGTGKWDGVNLYWFPPCAPGAGVPTKSGEFYFSPNPSYHYLYNSTEKDYLCGNPDMDWKWSRHFLASKGSDKEWILEGVVPEPMVFLLQLMRYYINSSISPSTEDKKAALVRTISTINPAQSSLSCENKSIVDEIFAARRKSLDASDPLSPKPLLAPIKPASPTVVKEKESSSRREKKKERTSTKSRDSAKPKKSK